MKKILLGTGILLVSSMGFSALAEAENAQRCLQLYYMKSYEQALPFCLIAGEEGDSQSQYVLGLMHADGQGTAKSKDKAIKWFRAAAKQGYAAALYKLQQLESEAPDDIIERFMAKRKASGSQGAIRPQTETAPEAKQVAETGAQSTTQNPAIATATATESAVTGPAVTGAAVATPATTEPAVAEPADPAAVATTEPQAESSSPLAAHAADDEQAAASLQDADSMQASASEPTRAAPQVDLETQFQQYLAASEQGDAHAQYMLGLFYAEGRAVAQDDVQAAGLFRLASDQNLADAQFSLGLMYYAGRGIEQDENQAIFWLGKAAEQGHIEAQYSLGLIYTTSSTHKNEAEAAQWWLKAAAQNHPKAQHNLAVMYLKGLGVEANRDKAIKWFHQEAEQGNPEAQFNLGLLYSQGQWADKSGEEAANWFYRAGESWLLMGSKEKARKAAEKIRQLSAQNQLNVPNLFLADVLTKKIEETSSL